MAEEYIRVLPTTCSPCTDDEITEVETCESDEIVPVESCGGRTLQWGNCERSYTAVCTGDLTGDPVTKSVMRNTLLSNISQEDADAQALALATSQANAAIRCYPTTTFGCGSFDYSWFQSFGDWPVVANTVEEWSVDNTLAITPMCVRFVGYCNDASGNIASQHVLGSGTDSDYLTLAAPFRNTAPFAETIISIKFYGTRPRFGYPRPCTGGLSHYVIRKKP